MAVTRLINGVVVRRGSTVLESGIQVPLGGIKNPYMRTVAWGDAKQLRGLLVMVTGLSGVQFGL